MDLAEDNTGPSMICVAMTEGGIYLPSLGYSILAYISVAGSVTCNTRAALEGVLFLQAVSCLFVCSCIAPCATEAISSKHTFTQGLAAFHGSPVHRLLQLHVLCDLSLMVFGAMAILTTNDLLCSMLLPKAVANLLLIQGVVLILRILEHFLFPWCVWSFNRRNPLGKVAGPKRAGNHERKTAKYDLDDGADDWEKVRAILDYNFHKIQTAWTYREKLPKLLDPADKNKKNKKKKKKKSNRVAPAGQQIVVRPRSSASVVGGALESKDNTGDLENPSALVGI